MLTRGCDSTEPLDHQGPSGFSARIEFLEDWQTTSRFRAICPQALRTEANTHREGIDLILQRGRCVRGTLLPGVDMTEPSETRREAESCLTY